MRKGLIFKKGIIFALAAALVTSPAPVMGVSGWGVMNAKAEETTTEKIPKYLLMGSKGLLIMGNCKMMEFLVMMTRYIREPIGTMTSRGISLYWKMRIFLETLQFRTVIFRLCYPEQIL